MKSFPLRASAGLRSTAGVGSNSKDMTSQVDVVPADARRAEFGMEHGMEHKLLYSTNNELNRVSSTMLD